MDKERKIPVVCYSRIVGYFAPYSLTANPGKREEIAERKLLTKSRLLSYNLKEVQNESTL